MRHVLALAALLPLAGHAHAKGSPVPLSDLEVMIQDYLSEKMIFMDRPEITSDGLFAKVNAYVGRQNCTVSLERTQSVARPWRVSALECSKQWHP